MYTQDREVVKALLQYMTDKCLVCSSEFRAALKHFNITTTYTSQQMTDESAKLFKMNDNHFVVVYSYSDIDAEPHGTRHSFATKAEAEAFAAGERTKGDAPISQAAIDATHDEALRVNARRRVAEFFGGLDHAGRMAKLDEAHTEALVMDAEREPDAISVNEALAIFFDRYAVLDAQAVGKRYIVAIPSGIHEGKLLKHGTYYTRATAQKAIDALSHPTVLHPAQLVVLKAQ